MSELQSHSDIRKCNSCTGFPWWLSGKESTCQCRRRGVQSLIQGDPLEKEIATHSSILAWEIPQTEAPIVIYRTLFARHGGVEGGVGQVKADSG